MNSSINPKDFLSAAVKNMPPSGIRKYFDLVGEMEDAISLGVGEPDFVTPWHIRGAGINALTNGKTYYTSNWGLKELREEISSITERKYNIKYNPSDEIIVTVGASEAVDMCLRAVIEPGDEIIVPEPSFVCYRPCADIMGAKTVTLSTKAENGFKIKKDELLSHITDKTKALILSYPNNPTGAVMTRDDLKELADVLKDKNILVISDEIYSELTYDVKHCSIAEFEGMRERTVVINGFSKAYAMTGFRLGYIMGPKEIIAAIVKLHQYGIMSAPTLSQYAGIEALKYGDSDIEMMKNEYNMRRRILVNGLNELGLTCFNPLGAFYVFPSIKSTGYTSEEFCEKLLHNEKLAVIPGSAFGKCGEGYVRISYAYSLDTIREALKRIETFLRKEKLL